MTDQTAADFFGATTIRLPVATSSIAGVGGTSPCTSTSWLPSAGYHGMSSPAARNGRCAESSTPGCRGASLSGRK